MNYQNLYEPLRPIFCNIVGNELILRDLNVSRSMAKSLQEYLQNSNHRENENNMIQKFIVDTC
jgi:hypothetical protein